jgi:hypothetical protein
VQSPPGLIQRVALLPAVSGRFLLNTPADLVQTVTGELDDVERVHHFHRGRQLFDSSGLEPGEPIHRHNLDTVAEVLRLSGQPGFEHGLRSSLDHVQQSRRACLIADRGEVDDHGDVLVATSGVPPYMLIDADDAHVVEPGRIVDEDPLPFGKDRVVSGVPGNGELSRDDGDRSVIDNECFQSPGEPGSGDLRPGWGCLIGVMAPHAPTDFAFVASKSDEQGGGAVPEGFVSQLPGHGVPRPAVSAASVAPLIVGRWGA